MANDNIGTSYNIRYITLYPIGGEFNLTQQQVDLNQVAAAQFGPAFWLCYNYFLGSAETECGWNRLESTSYQGAVINNVVQQLSLGANRGAGIAFINKDFFEEKFQFYKQYGEKIAGRYYISNARSEVNSDIEYSWFDNQTVQHFTIESLSRVGPLSSQILFPMSVRDTTIIPNTEINNSFPGLMTNGNRWIFIDNYDAKFDEKFVLSDRQKKIVETMANNLINGIQGSRGFDYSEIEGDVEYVIFYDQFAGSDEIQFSDLVGSKIEFLEHRFSSFSIKGIKTTSLNQRLDEEKEGDFDVQTNEPPEESESGEIIDSPESTATVSRKPNSETVAYFRKFQVCTSKSSNNSGAFSRKFVPKEMSTDLPVGRTLEKNSKDIYVIRRTFSYINNNTQLLNALASSNLIPLETVSFSLNYFKDDVPVSFISNGLTSLSISVDSQGVTASYSYSNRMMEVPTPEYLAEKLEQNMRNSWTRRYNPTERALE